MALRIRRGTNAERQTIIFAEGELVYTTDTKDLFVGDGITLGGIPAGGGSGGGLSAVIDDLNPSLGGNLNLNSREINGTGDISITGTITADVVSSGIFIGDGSGLSNIAFGGSLNTDLNLNNQEINGTGDIDITGTISADVITGGIFIGDGSGLTNLPGGDGIVEGSTYRINIVDDGSSIMVNTSTSTLDGILIGNVDNEIIITTDLTINNNDSRGINLNGVTLGNLGADLKYAVVRNSLISPAILEAGDTIIDIIAQGFDGVDAETPAAIIKLGVDRYTSAIGNDIMPGRILFLTYNESGTTGLNNALVFNRFGNLGIATDDPQEKLDVRGNGIFDGNLTADSVILNGTTQTEINEEAEDSTLLTGRIVYNSTNDRFQFFQAGSWVSLINNGSSMGQLLAWNGSEWSAVDPIVGEGTIENANFLNGFNGSFYLDYNNFTNTPSIPNDLTDLGIADGTVEQVLTTDGSGNFSFAAVSGLKSRDSLTGSTGSIADDATANVNITGYKGYMLYKIQTSAAAWVRLYVSDAARTADATRTQGQDPLPGSGVIAEVITTGAETVIIAPGVIGFNNETPVTNVVPAAVTNLTGGSADITVTLTAVEMEI
jgi:hypothetical protein